MKMEKTLRLVMLPRAGEPARPYEQGIFQAGLGSIDFLETPPERYPIAMCGTVVFRSDHRPPRYCALFVLPGSI